MIRTRRLQGNHLEGYAKRCEVFPKDMHVLRVVGTFYGKDVHGNVSTSPKIGSPLKVLMQKDVRSSRRMYILKGIWGRIEYVGASKKYDWKVVHLFGREVHGLAGKTCMYFPC